MSESAAGSLVPGRGARGSGVVAAGILAALGGILALPLVGFGDLPAVTLLALPLACAAAVFLLWNTHVGLCFAAFSIAPLGIVQYELYGVTLGLPEVLILALFVKEFSRFVYHGEPFVPAMPLASVSLYLGAALLGIGTGLAYHNGTVRVLQDFRQFVEFIVLFWLILHRVKTPEQAARIAFFYVLGCTAIAIHGIVQQYTPIGIPPSQILSDMAIHKGIRSGSFYGSTPLGGRMVLTSGAAIGLSLASPSKARRLLLGICLALCLAAIVFTKTRAAWLALVLTSALILFSIKPSPRVLGTALAGVVAVAFFFGPQVVQRMMTMTISHKERSMLKRTQYYTAAAYIVRAHPTLGLGWGCYYDIDTIRQNRRYVPEAPPSNDAQATVHSAYLQILVKTGLVGLGSFVLILVRWFQTVVRHRFAKERDPSSQYLMIGISAGLIGYLFHSGFENFFQWPVMAQSFWLLMGLSLVSSAPASSPGPAPGHTRG